MQSGRKRCTLGKNCGGTCINRGKECQLELGATLSAALGKVIAHVQGKKTPAHAAAVVGDTVGDPFKDTAGPSLHVLIKLLSTITLVLAPLFI